MAYTKLARKRDPSVPQGQAAPMHLDCPCGQKVPVTNDTNPCPCGAVYDSDGWVITASLASKTEQASQYAS
jgi:hypothetical protein